MFCEKCGSQIPEGTNVCPNCAAVNNPTPAPAPAPEQVVYQQAPQQAAPQQVYQQPVYQQAAPAANGGGVGTVGLICGIVGIVLSVLGSIMFGLICSTISIILSVVGLIIGINMKKQTGKGSSAFVCGLIGLICGIIFTAGCGICAAVSSCGDRYNPINDMLGIEASNPGCYGCVGSSCIAEREYDKWEDAIESIWDIY